MMFRLLFVGILAVALTYLMQFLVRCGVDDSGRVCLNCIRPTGVDNVFEQVKDMISVGMDVQE